MAELSTIARPYAEALFAAARAGKVAAADTGPAAGPAAGAAAGPASGPATGPAQADFKNAPAPGGAGVAAQWAQAVDAIAAIVADPAAAAALSNPALDDAQRMALIGAVAGKTVPAPVHEMLKLILENGRLAAFPEVAAQFHALRNAADASADCIIESAFALSDADVAGLVAALAKKFPLKLKPEVRLNPALIGGVRVTVGDRVLDSSVRARLDAMQARLTA